MQDQNKYPSDLTQNNIDSVIPIEFNDRNQLIQQYNKMFTGVEKVVLAVSADKLGNILYEKDIKDGFITVDFSKFPFPVYTDAYLPKNQQFYRTGFIVLK